MTSPLKTWRQSRREAEFWAKARARSERLPKGETIGTIDVTIMMAGQAISRYRQLENPDMREDQLRELRMNLEAALGMLDTILPS